MYVRVFFSNFVPKAHRFCNIRLVKYTVTLKPGLGVTQGHQKLYNSIGRPWFPINVSSGIVTVQCQ